MRAREVLRAHPEGIAGGIDGWACRLGIKLVRARLACRYLEQIGEVDPIWVDGRQLRRWKPPTPRDHLQ